MSTETKSGTRHTAGIADVRNIIGILLGIYGVVLLIMGIFNYTGADKTKTDGINLNLWTGLALLIVSAALIGWAMVRPIVVDEAELAREKAGEQFDHPSS